MFGLFSRSKKIEYPDYTARVKEDWTLGIPCVEVKVGSQRAALWFSDNLDWTNYDGQRTYGPDLKMAVDVLSRMLHERQTRKEKKQARLSQQLDQFFAKEESHGS